MRYCKDIVNLLFWVLLPYPTMATKNDGISFSKALMFIYMRKIYLILLLSFLEIWRIWRILQCDWPTAFCPITGEPECCQIRSLQWNINIIMIFHFSLFPGKLEEKILQRMQKMPFSSILFLFGQIRIFLTSVLTSFLPLRQISKTNNKRIPSNTGLGRMDGPTSGQIWVYGTLSAKACDPKIGRKRMPLQQQPKFGRG